MDAPLLLPAAYDAAVERSCASVAAAVALIAQRVADRLVLVSLPCADEAVDALEPDAHRLGVTLRVEGAEDSATVIVEPLHLRAVP